MKVTQSQADHDVQPMAEPGTGYVAKGEIETTAETASLERRRRQNKLHRAERLGK